MLAQRLAGPLEPDPASAVSWMSCLQAQDFRAARSAVAARSGSSIAQVDAALASGAVVRSWPMRGTLHLVAASDLDAKLDLTAERTLKAADRRHRELSIEPRDVDRAIDVALAVLDARGGADRVELFAAWEAHGIGTAKQRGVHLLQILCLRRVLVLGPLSDNGTQQFVEYRGWVGPRATPDLDASVAGWARQYFRSHGPATLEDFRWWTGLPLRAIAPGWDAARAELAQMRVDDRRYFLDARTLEAWETHATRTLAPTLTAAFDEILLGYADRTATLPVEHMAAVVPGNNGMFRAVLLDGGRAVATWRRGARRGDPLRIEPLEAPLTTRAAKAVPGLARRFPLAD